MPQSDAPYRLGLVAAGCTDVGRIRSRNEDAYLIAALADPLTVTKGMTELATIPDHPVCLIVADGVGGAASGELASLMAVDTIVGQLRRQYREGAFTTLRNTGRAMLQALAMTNQVVYTYARNHPEHYGMATTVTLAMTSADSVLLAQIGDSRAYLVRAGEVKQLTKDQSLVQQLVDIGELTEVEAAQSSHRNIILQALGSERVIIPDLYAAELVDGDLLLLCSDGLSNYVALSDIASLTADESDLTAICRTLIACANERGGDDNITVVAARFAPAETLRPLSTTLCASDVTPALTSPTLADRMRRWLR